MRSIRLSIMVLISLVCFSACATAPTQKQLSEADYGSYPDNYQEVVRAYYSRILFDPYSAHFRWIKPPYSGYFSAFSKIEFGYIVHIGVNAKNRMGGYVGEKQEALLIKNGMVIDRMPLSMIKN